MGFNTKLVHAGIPDDPLGSVTTPIYQTSTFAFRNARQGADRFAGDAEGFIYSRIGNPTTSALEQNVAQLENGFGATATASGMGAVSTAYMALLSQGDHMVSTAVGLRALPGAHGEAHGPVRGGVHLRRHHRPGGPEAGHPPHHQAGLRGIPIQSGHAGDRPGGAAAEIAHAAGALLVVDNTFASPYLQKPLDLGADVVLHSVTKFINGHADVVGGVLVAGTEALHKQLRAMVVIMGCCMDPHQASLVSRGLKTLAIRMERAQANTLEIARWLERHPKVEWVQLPGPAQPPQSDLVRRQMAGPGAMLSFGVKGGVEAGARLMDAVKLAALAVSLGGVETLICHPASMTHASMGREARREGGVADGLVRYSVGIEDLADLIADLEQALDQV